MCKANLKKLDHEAVMHWFREISRIPRASGSEQAPGGICDYIANFAHQHGIDYRRYPNGDIHMWLRASPGFEDAAPILIQAHMDMVGVKIVRTAEGEKQVPYNGPIELIEQDKWLHANGTTLGADDGMGVAAILALFANNSFEHGPIGAFLTVEEETTMKGAREADPQIFPLYKYLINLDAEEWPLLCCGSGYGKPADMEKPLSRMEMNGRLFVVNATGFQGQHSGLFPGNTNAIKKLFDVLSVLYKSTPFHLIRVDGGSASNAIPASCGVHILLPNDTDPEKFQSDFDQEAKLVTDNCESTDPHARLSCKPQEVGTYRVIQETANVLNLIAAIPSGVKERDESENPQTALNLGRLTTLDEDGNDSNSILARILIRSTTESNAIDLYHDLEVISAKHACSISSSGLIMGWDGRGTRLLELAIETAEDLFGMTVNTLNYLAGLECGGFMKFNPKMEMLSIGPLIKDVHSPKERVYIESIRDWFQYLVELIGRIPGLRRIPVEQQPELFKP